MIINTWNITEEQLMYLIQEINRKNAEFDERDNKRDSTNIEKSLYDVVLDMMGIPKDCPGEYVDCKINEKGDIEIETDEGPQCFDRDPFYDIFKHPCYRDRDFLRKYIRQISWRKKDFNKKIAVQKMLGV